MTNDIKIKHLIELLMTVTVPYDAIQERMNAIYTQATFVKLPLMCIASTQLYACDLALRRSQLSGLSVEL